MLAIINAFAQVSKTPTHKSLSACLFCIRYHTPAVKQAVHVLCLSHGDRQTVHSAEVVLLFHPIMPYREGFSLFKVSRLRAQFVNDF